MKAVAHGVVLTMVLIAIHPWAFGGHPLGQSRIGDERDA